MNIPDHTVRAIVFALFLRISVRSRIDIHEGTVLIEQVFPHTQSKQILCLGNAMPVWGVKPKQGWYVFWLFFKIGLCSAISLERTRRELSIDVAEHRSILKNNQNTNYPRFSFTPKTGIAFPKTSIYFFTVQARII